MIEILWACLLLIALLDRQARPLVFLLAFKWFLSYAAFDFEQYRLIVVVDVAAGLMAARMMDGITARRFCLLAGLFVLSPLIHALYWMIADAGHANYAIRVAYYTLLATTFTAKVCSLSWPGVMNLVGAVSNFAAGARRSLLDRMAFDAGQAPRFLGAHAGTGTGSHRTGTR